MLRQIGWGVQIRKEFYRELLSFVNIQLEHNNLLQIVDLITNYSLFQVNTFRKGLMCFPSEHPQ